MAGNNIGNVAIGLYKNATGNWQWTDGSTYDYDHWHADVNGNANYTKGMLGFYVDMSSYPSYYWEGVSDSYSGLEYGICQVH